MTDDERPTPIPASSATGSANAGEDGYLLKLHLREIDDLEAILDRFTPYGQTTTSIVHSAPFPPRPLPLRP